MPSGNPAENDASRPLKERSAVELYAPRTISHSGRRSSLGGSPRSFVESALRRLDLLACSPLHGLLAEARTAKEPVHAKSEAAIGGAYTNPRMTSHAVMHDPRIASRGVRHEVPLSALECDVEREGYLVFRPDTALWKVKEAIAPFVHGGNRLPERVIPVLARARHDPGQDNFKVRSRRSRRARPPRSSSAFASRCGFRIVRPAPSGFWRPRPSRSHARAEAANPQTRASHPSHARSGELVRRRHLPRRIAHPRNSPASAASEPSCHLVLS